MISNKNPKEKILDMRKNSTAQNRDINTNNLPSLPIYRENNPIQRLTPIIKPR